MKDQQVILFRGITSEQKMQSLIAKALRTDLNLSVQISMKAVKGIAAGFNLSYIRSKNIPMYQGTMNNNLKWENFNIFTGYDDEPIISFDPSSTVHENDSVLQTFDDEIDGSSGVEVLSGICQQLFSGANSILYDDSPEREFDVYDREGFPRVPPSLEDTKGTSNVSGSKDSDMSSSSNSTEKPKSSRPPRREVWWHDLGAKNQSLESIKRCFEDCLDRFLSSSSSSLLRHITSPMDSRLRRNLHQCPGYLREEIALVSDASKSVIVSHAFPSQSEVCSICGQLVQYTEPSIIDVEMQETPVYHTTSSSHAFREYVSARDKTARWVQSHSPHLQTQTPYYDQGSTALPKHTPPTIVYAPSHRSHQPHYGPPAAMFHHPPRMGPNGMIYSHSAPVKGQYPPGNPTPYPSVVGGSSHHHSSSAHDIRGHDLNHTRSTRINPASSSTSLNSQASHDSGSTYYVLPAQGQKVHVINPITSRTSDIRGRSSLISIRTEFAKFWSKCRVPIRTKWNQNASKPKLAIRTEVSKNIQVTA